MDSSLIEEHRVLELRLDEMIAAMGAGVSFVDSFRMAARLACDHYRREESFLEQLAQKQAGVAAKLRAQHAEVLEIAARLEEALGAGQDADALRLARRFCAIAQHNIIEEERDVFPLW